jgi:hypothetical protein
MTSKIKSILTAQIIVLTLAFLLLPTFANSQINPSSKTRDTLNIGFVLYTKASTREHFMQDGITQTSGVDLA